MYRAPKFDGSCPLKEFSEISNNSMLLGKCGTAPFK
jgi:hypothetical protein